jgi:chromosome segregation ATPase
MLITVASAQPTGATSNVSLLILLAITGGALPGLAWQIWRRLRSGALDDAREIAGAVSDSVASSNQLYTQYKLELEAAHRQLNEYLTQLLAVNRELGQTMGRISKLETDLQSARGEVVALREELARAYEQRDQLHTQVQQLQERIGVLEKA